MKKRLNRIDKDRIIADLGMRLVRAALVARNPKASFADFQRALNPSYVEKPE